MPLLTSHGYRPWLVGAYVCSVAQSCLIHCNPMDCSPPGSSVHESFQRTILEQVAIFSSGGSSRPRDRTHVSCMGRQVLSHCTAWEALNIYLEGAMSTHQAPGSATSCQRSPQQEGNKITVWWQATSQFTRRTKHLLNLRP